MTENTEAAHTPGPGETDLLHRGYLTAEDIRLFTGGTANQERIDALYDTALLINAHCCTVAECVRCTDVVKEWFRGSFPLTPREYRSLCLDLAEREISPAAWAWKAGE